MSYQTLDLSKGINLEGYRKNPSCPKRGDKVRTTSSSDKFFGSIGLVDSALVQGASFIVSFPTPHGKAFLRYMREDLEVIEEEETKEEKELKDLHRIYRRYARVRLLTILDLLHIVLKCSTIGEVIHNMVREARMAAFRAFDSKDAEEFLKENGLPSKDIK